jgi:hypothetical protein
MDFAYHFRYSNIIYLTVVKAVQRLNMPVAIPTWLFVVMPKNILSNYCEKTTFSKTSWEQRKCTSLVCHILRCIKLIKPHSSIPFITRVNSEARRECFHTAIVITIRTWNSSLPNVWEERSLWWKWTDLTSDLEDWTDWIEENKSE